MRAFDADLSWLSDPEVFAVNRKRPHSDHFYYETIKEAEGQGNMPLRQSLNGTWYFSYAQNPSQQVKDFYKTDFNSRTFDRMEIPER